jgi:hypothetical protein
MDRLLQMLADEFRLYKIETDDRIARLEAKLRADEKAAAQAPEAVTKKAPTAT